METLTQVKKVKLISAFVLIGQLDGQTIRTEPILHDNGSTFTTVSGKKYRVESWSD